MLAKLLGPFTGRTALAVLLAGVPLLAMGAEEVLVEGCWKLADARTSRPPRWRLPDFDDSSWAQIKAGGPTGAHPTQPLGGWIAPLRLRMRFELADPSELDRLTLRLASSGSVTVTLNGIEVLRSPRPLPVTVEASSGKLRGYAVDLSGVIDELVRGSNLLAVELEAGPDGRASLPSLPTLHARRVLRSRGAEPARIDGPRPREALMELAPIDGELFVILMICDGWGALQIDATNSYLGSTPDYQSDSLWARLWMSTYPAGGGYDPASAWSDPTYPLGGATDSAAAATAMFSGEKTSNGRIGVNADGSSRVTNLGERARTLAMAHGAVSSVHLSHATPGGFVAHNLSRTNTFAIADEGLFGHPNSTGDPTVDPRYGGGFGSTLPPSMVLIGSRNSAYVHHLQSDKLVAESGTPGAYRFVQGLPEVDYGDALLAAAADPSTVMLAGLFDRVDLRASAPDNGYRPEAPRLAESALAAISTLERHDNGFVLMIEGGAVDWGGHANDLDRVIGELKDFNDAVAAVVEWIENPGNRSSWSNTLLVVTGDHETGYLTAVPGGFSNQTLTPGSISNATLALEKVDLSSGRRASWVDDNPANDQIDPGEIVYWAWNTGGHSNSLVPLYARGAGAELFDQLAVASDPVRGAYIDNTDLFLVADAVLDAGPGIFADGFESGGTASWSFASAP